MSGRTKRIIELATSITNNNDNGNAYYNEEDFNLEGYDSDRDPPYEAIDSSDEESEEETPCSRKRRRNMEQKIQNVPDLLNDSITLENDNIEGGAAQANEVAKPYARKLRAERTLKRHTGQEYVTAKGKVQRKRAMKPLPNCRMKCKDWLKSDTRQTIFEEYWKVGTHERRMNFIGKLVTSHPVKTHRVRNVDSFKEWSMTFSYAFEINGERRNVCKGCFQATLDETDKFINNTIKNKSNSVTGVLKEDHRGKHEPANKTKPEQLKEVLTHIESFPKYESHYTRRVNDKLYLPSYLNLSKMYSLYREVYSNPISRKIYESEFHKLKLSFKVPKTDMCHKCELMKMKLDITVDENERTQVKLEQEKHHQEADMAYECKKADKNASKTDKSSICFTFDLQQCLATPFLETSVSFYKRKYWTYNLTIHNCGTGYASCYVWHESLAMRGANEISSCLFKEIMNLPEGIKKLTFYSDTCGGQNKNSYVIAMFLAVMQLKPSLEEINHKFLLSGHSHMECDVDHSLIERQKKTSGMKIAHPHDWATLIRCTNKKKPFNVIEMSQEDFLNFAALLKGSFVKKQKNTEGDAFKLHECKWLRYTRQVGIVKYRTSLDEEEEFKEVNFNRRGRPTSFELEKRYNDTLPISDEKKNHLIQLLSLVPEVYQSFYKNLKTTTMPDVDPDLQDYNGDSE